jgi:hypothetical protein
MPVPLLLGAGAAIGGLASIGKAIFGGGQRKAAKKIKPYWEQYQESPYAKSQLGIAQQLFGGRMGGAASQEQNIAANQASTVSNINRGATDSAQALALSGMAQGQSNEAYADLGIKEAQNKQMMLGNLNQAYGTLIGEGDKRHQSMIQKYQMDVAQKQALLSGGSQNIFGGLGDLASLGIYAGQMDWGKKK